MSPEKIKVFKINTGQSWLRLKSSNSSANIISNTVGVLLQISQNISKCYSSIAWMSSIDTLALMLAWMVMKKASLLWEQREAKSRPSLPHSSVPGCHSVICNISQTSSSPKYWNSELAGTWDLTGLWFSGWAPIPVGNWNKKQEVGRRPGG